MKYTLFALVALFMVACGNQTTYVPVQSAPSNQVVNHVGADYEEFYDGSEDFPHTVLRFLKTAPNGMALQQMLNTQGNHNLDLDQDGYIDMCRVIERDRSGLYSYKKVFIIQAYNYNSWQDVVRIDLSNRTGMMVLELSGNSDIYGEGYYLHPTFAQPLRNYAFFVWSYSPRLYVSSWDLRYSPSTYRYSTVSRSVYRTRTKSVTRVKTTRSSAPKLKRSGKYTMKSNPKVKQNTAKRLSSKTSSTKASSQKVSQVNQNRKHGYKETKNENKVGGAFGKKPTQNKATPSKKPLDTKKAPAKKPTNTKKYPTSKPLNTKKAPPSKNNRPKASRGSNSRGKSSATKSNSRSSSSKSKTKSSRKRNK